MKTLLLPFFNICQAVFNSAEQTIDASYVSDVDFIEKQSKTKCLALKHFTNYLA